MSHEIVFYNKPFYSKNIAIALFITIIIVFEIIDQFNSVLKLSNI